MGRRLPATFGFAVGLGAASLLNLDFYSAIAKQAIASLHAPIGQNATAQASLSHPFTTATSCNANGNPIASLRSSHPQNISLLKHVPTLPQRLNWYGITQESAIANAPKSATPKPAITQWNRGKAEDLAHPEPCGDHPLALVAQGQKSTLQQQAHFILSLASLNPKNNWLIQVQPQAIQPVHTVWRDQAPMEITLASQLP